VELKHEIRKTYVIQEAAVSLVEIYDISYFTALMIRDSSVNRVTENILAVRYPVSVGIFSLPLR
jgi:hypothetical protein